MTLETHILAEIDNGLVDLQLRVARFVPLQWQAIAKYRDRLNGPWGVGVHADPIEAVRVALGADEPAPPAGIFE